MVLKVTDADFKQEVLESEMPVLVDFWAEWCAPCHIVAPVIEAIFNKYKDKLKVCKLNIDEAINTASEYGIMSIPTLMIFKGGQAADKVVGALSEAALEITIKKYI
jgi:thioredoxin 1